MPTLTFKKDDAGYSIKATITEFDGVTPKDLTGLTATLQCVDTQDSEQSRTIEGVLVDAANGVVRFDVPEALFDTVTTYNAEVELRDGTGYIEDTKTFKIKIIAQVLEEE